MSNDQTDRRRHVRHEVRQTALAVVEDGVTRLDATIVNVSESGARIELDEPTKLTDTFYLLIPDHRLQPCRVVWRNAVGAGVSYVA